MVWFEGLFFFAIRYLKFERLNLGILIRRVSRDKNFCQVGIGRMVKG
jgi:hypothetical protein